VRLFGALLLAVVATWLLRRLVYERRIGEAAARARSLLDEARLEAERSSESAREQAQREVRARAFTEAQKADEELTTRRRALDREAERLAAREAEIDSRGDVLDRKATHVERRADQLIERARQLDDREARLGEIEEEKLRRLEQLGGMSRDQATEELRRSVDEEARARAEREAERVIQEARGNADRTARDIAAAAIQRCAVEQVSESTVTPIELASEDLKGRIIGKEGRNIRAFEFETGVDVIIDETPERVFLSSFDPERREIARMALERLLADGRVHPARIEEVVADVRGGFDRQIRELGEAAAFECEVYGLAEELVPLVGRLRYRALGGQNLLTHSIEVSQLAGAMAQMIDADEALARRAGLLHEIGWAVNGKTSGDPARATPKLLERHGETPALIQAARGATRRRPARGVEEALVAAGNEMSQSRPGARREQLNRHVRRLHAMERVAAEIPGVITVYALEAGRDLVVIVDPEQMDDVGAYDLSRKISKKIERELMYSGSIRVTVIRRSRCSALAR